MAIEITYKAEPTLSRLHLCDSFYRGIRGPVRSGKSTGMCMDIMNRSRKQRPGQAGIRRTRWAAIRNTYRELEDTTLRTWLMWFPEYIFGAFNHRTMTHTIQFNDIYMEVMFRALDRADDVSKLLSMELTGAWTNETREMPKAIIDVLGDRVGQYPPKMDEGCTWGGVMMDTNSPDDDSWWATYEANPPEGWTFFVQPGALIEHKGKFIPNHKAENIKNLNEGMDYYTKRMHGKAKSYIRVYYCNQFGFVEEGKRVHPDYVDAVHCSPSPLVPNPDHEVIVGLDFGLTPAATFWSRRPNGQWWLFHEIATEDIGIRKFGERLLLPYILSDLLDFNVTVYGDTWGNTRGQNDKLTPGQILGGLGLDIRFPSTEGGVIMRREALDAPLSRLIDGEPGILVDPSCKAIRKGLSSKYIFKRIKVSGDEKYHDVPEKNFWSHVCEAAEHAMLGAGEGKRLIRKPKSSRRTTRAIRSYGDRGWMAA